VIVSISCVGHCAHACRYEQKVAYGAFNGVDVWDLGEPNRELVKVLAVRVVQVDALHAYGLLIVLSGASYVLSSQPASNCSFFRGSGDYVPTGRTSSNGSAFQAGAC
jgi:hypothetical protein